MNDDLQARIEEAVRNPRNLGEMSDADAIGTVGSADCGDMLRMWVKFKEEDGRKVIDRATFQTFGCQTAIAVASVATEMLAGKTDRGETVEVLPQAWWCLTENKALNEGVPSEAERRDGWRKAVNGRTVEIGWLARKGNRRARFEELTLAHLGL